MNVHAHASVVHLFWEQEQRCLELLMMAPAKLASSRKCLGPNVLCVWGMCFKHGQQIWSALWKWCSLIVVDWHKSTQLFIFSSSGHCEIKNHFKTTGFRLPTPPPIIQSWKTKSGHALFARMVLYFTAVRQCQSIPSTLTDWGRGWEIPWAIFSNGSLFRNDRTPKLTKTCFLRPEGFRNVYV
jgi:hypothetical protein